MLIVFGVTLGWAAIVNITTLDALWIGIVGLVQVVLSCIRLFASTAVFSNR